MPALEAVVLGPALGDGEGKGLGEPAGLGLGRIPAEPWLLDARLPRTANAVPQPAMISTSTTIPLMIRTHGVRWTGGWGPTALGW
jgi:hypothetical protein